MFKLEKPEKIKEIINDNCNCIKIICYSELSFRIYTSHYQDCCEKVYADFSVIEEQKEDIKGIIIIGVSVKKIKDEGFLLLFEYLEDDKFGNSAKKIFIPCHNIQNGYYSSDLELMIKHNNDTISIDITDCTKDDIY